MWGLGHLGVECWHVISCSAIQAICLRHVVCLCIVMWHQSAVTKIAFSIRGGRDSRSCRKCFLSQIYEGSISTKVCMKWVT